MQSTYRHLNLQDRCTIYRLLKQGKTQMEIAETIGFSPGALSREISRNKGKR